MARHERGTQTPLETLERGRGTCRDFAILMMEAARTLGFAARFVSGYLHTPRRNSDPLKFRGGGNTHAWVRIYMPGGGWAEFDPTNGIIGNRNLIRVAVTRDALQAVPLSGTWLGFPGAYLGMDVEVDVQEDGAAQKPKRVGAL
jgi:transglutaminase-like putative cysteine protease